MKSPGIFEHIEAMGVDFDNPDFSNTWADPFANLHQAESEIREKMQVTLSTLINKSIADDNKREFKVTKVLLL